MDEHPSSDASAGPISAPTLDCMLQPHLYGEMEWIDIVDPTENDLLTVAKKYGLRRPNLDDATRRAERPTLRRHADHAYLVAFSGQLAEIDMYIGPTWLVTVRRHDPE